MLSWTIALLTLLAPAGTLAPPTALCCEGRVDPVGVDYEPPRLSWRLAPAKANGTDAMQTAWQVATATSLDELKGDTGDLWDSGKQPSADTFCVDYAGPRLDSAERVWWKVRVWDANDKPSAWSKPANFTMGLLTPEVWQAQWITSPDQTPPPSLMARRDFLVRQNIARAVLYVCGLGQMEVHINGQNVSDHLMTPGWTNYKKTCLYEALDVTKFVKTGVNGIGILLGNGMYNVQGGRYIKFKGSMGQQKVIASLRLELTDGRVTTIGTDHQWKVTKGPITFSCIYGGEDWDANLEAQDWDKANFYDGAWQEAVEVAGPGGDLVCSRRSAPPITAYKIQTAVSDKTINATTRVYDLGGNGAIIPRITLSGKKGAKLRVTPGELVDDAGKVTQRSSGGPSYWEYTCGDKGTVVWQPRFTYYGSRWLQLEGDFTQIKVSKVQGLYICCSNEPVGTFSCSDDRFNKIAWLTENAVRSNMQSVFTDCPHREKLGWLEQVNLMGPAMNYCFDLMNMQTKIVGDMEDSQLENGLVPDIAPEYTVFVQGFRDSPEWGSTMIFVPWTLYTWYGDKQALADNYVNMKRYAAYLETTAKDGIVNHGLADWLEIGDARTPAAVTATSYLYHDLDILVKTAEILGKTDDVKSLTARRDAVGAAFLKHFWHADTAQVAEGTQTSLAMALVFGLVPEADRGRVGDNLAANVRAKGLTAGDVGHRYLLRALADTGHSDVIAALHRGPEDKPGYCNMLKKGATTLTEAWDAERTLSQNHFAMGHLVEWFYHDLAGLQPADDAIAWSKATIKPTLVDGVDWTDVSYRSPRGTYAVRWERKAGAMTMTLTIPAGCRADVWFPTSDPSSVKVNGAKSDATVKDAGWWRHELGSGKWILTGSAPAATK